MNTFFDYIKTPIGYWSISANEKSIVAIQFHAETPAVKKHVSELTDLGIDQLKEYFEKKRKTFELPLNTSEYSPFFNAVWKEVSNVPFGKTLSYSDIAHKINNPKSVRAVGLANGKNPFPIVIPCHRILGKDKSLTGYASGIDVKKWLLEHEEAIAVQTSLFE